MQHAMKRRSLAQAVLLSLCAFQALPVMAQGAPASQTAQNPAPKQGKKKNKSSKTLSTITVYSERHPEKLQKAAAPITVFTQAKILNAGIQTPADFVRLVPNMGYDTSFTIGNSFVTMRGIQEVNNADSPVAIVVDGVPQNNQKEFKQNLFDIQQIEVLRGPQGALYGRNAIGGAIIIKTKQPTNDTEGFVQMGAGNDGMGKIVAAVSGPFVKDKLFYRVAVDGDTFDGSFRNSYTGQKVDNYKDHDVRGMLKWVPATNQSLELRFHKSQLWGGAIFDTSFPAATPDATNIWQAPLSNTPGTSSRRVTDAALVYRVNAPSVVFTSITGYTKLFEDYHGDLDFCNPVVCPGGLFGLGQAEQAQVLHVRELSQEFRLGSPDGSAVKWTAGIYGIHTDRDLQTVANVFLTPTTVVPVIQSNEGDRNNAWAVYGQVQIPVSSVDRLGFSLRYDRDERNQTDLSTGSERSTDFGMWQPKVTWSHDVSPTQMFYATIAKGFRSGGFNGVGGQPFQAESLTNYEIGYKTRWLGNRLTFNNALFYDIDHNYQFFYIDLSAGGAQVIANLKRVRISGLESELDWEVRPGWKLYGSLGLLWSRIEEVGELGTTLPINVGNRIPRSRPYTAVLGSQWNFNVAGHSAMVRLDVSRDGRRTWEPDNIDIMDPVTLVNLRMTWFGNSGWSVTAWGTNLFNHHYYSDFVPNSFSGLGRDTASPAKGRLFGVNFRYEF